MPHQNNQKQMSESDFDRRMVDLSHVVALDPKNANAHRERAFLYACKGDLDHALIDLNQALLLNPKDARAYNLRGQVLHAKDEHKKAIADYDKAIEFDPANANFYRARKEESLNVGVPQGQHQSGAEPSKSEADSKETPQQGLAGFFKRLAQYYAEFLSTDFKKQRLPRRRLQSSDAQGRLVGIPLQKYPGFQQKMWEELASP
jgi:tetratricopeptide (TPR) repeat protein